MTNLITDYLYQIEEIQKQQYFNYLANIYLSNNFIYNQTLQEMQQQGFSFNNMTPFQITSYVHGYVVSNHADTLSEFGKQNNITLDNFIANQNQLITNNFAYTNPYQPPMFPNI